MRLFAFEPFAGKGVLCSDGATWEHSRALIKPTFARTQIADLHLSTFASHVDKVIRAIPLDGCTVDLQHLFARLALDSSTEFLFGESVSSLSPDAISVDAQAFLDAYNYGQKVVGDRLHLPKWNFLTQDRKFKDCCKVAHYFVDGYIAKAQAIYNDLKIPPGDQKRYILAHELVKTGEDLETIRSQLLNIFLPAHEAAGVALTNVFFHLARHPSVYTKLREEILTAGADQTAWTFERLKGLKYLQQVISEMFRLNPPIGTNARMALRDAVLPTGGGLGDSPIFVKKGDVLTISYYALHRRKDLFGDDANLFRPERWDTLRPVHWSYLPFSGGPRVCPGQNLALTEVGYTVVKIVEAFKEIINRDPVEEFEEVYKITTDSKNGAKVTMIPN